MTNIASSSTTGSTASLADTAKTHLASLRGMTTLDRSAFTTRIPIVCARIEPGQVSQLKNHPMLRGQLLDIRRIPSITSSLSSSDKLLRLRAGSEDQLPATVREFLLEKGKGFERDTVELGYEYWNASEVLNAILPDVGAEDAPSSFTQTGHIGHVNLRDEWLPYKHLIGQVILDKNPQMRTVVNKLNTIHAEYRYFDMEVLAGEPDFVATVNEGNCSFTLDFQKVYWNSRLHHEHERLVSLFQPGEVIADVMAGVGPFAIPAAKKGCRVLGNDLNPEGVKWMAVNREKNKVEANLRVSEMDGRAFIPYAPLYVWNDPFPPVEIPQSRKQRDKAARQARNDKSAIPSLTLSTTASATVDSSTPTSRPSEESHQQVDHYVMNLPDSALTFLDAFRGSYVPLQREGEGYDRAQGKMPMVHVYCFTREMEREAAQRDICQRAAEHLGYPVQPSMEDYNLHLVRSVAPNKDMYCLSFRLPREVAFAQS